jgi:hypothetical protein
LWAQAFTADTLAQAPELWAALGESFNTDLTMGEIAQLAQSLYGIDARNVHSTSLGADAVQSWTTPEGAWVLLPQTKAIRQVILGLLSA